MPVAEAAELPRLRRHRPAGRSSTTTERSTTCARSSRRPTTAGSRSSPTSCSTTPPSEHPWFVDSQTPGSAHEDWYIWSDENPGYGGPDGQPVWHEAGGRYYYGLFGPDLPDLNLRNPAVTAGARRRRPLLARRRRRRRLPAGRDQAPRRGRQDPGPHDGDPRVAARLPRPRSRRSSPARCSSGEVSDVAAGSSQYVPEDVDLVFDFGARRRDRRRDRPRPGQPAPHRRGGRGPPVRTGRAGDVPDEPRPGTGRQRARAGRPTSSAWRRGCCWPNRASRSCTTGRRSG